MNFWISCWFFLMLGLVEQNAVLGLIRQTEVADASEAGSTRKTRVTISEEAFMINGKPTYEGRTWNGQRIEGLLMNSRMVQGIFDDRNLETRAGWAYPDTGQWDADRNTREFVEAMPDWREHGLLAFTINLQGGSPEGYSQKQPWRNSAIVESGELDPAYMGRLALILDRADELGMVAIVGIFYFGQDQRIADEAGVIRGVDNTVNWLLDRGYQNVLLEINNECDIAYDHEILKPHRVHELIERAQSLERDGRRLLVSTSYGGGRIPAENVVRSADYLLLHGNGVSDPDRIRAMVEQTRQVAGYRPMPILFNEDDHYHFDRTDNNFAAAVASGASWGYFDFRRKRAGKEEPFEAGFQSVPVDWRISEPRKKQFFEYLKKITQE